MTLKPGRVQGKVALVTGAGGGIGADCALALAREGAVVALADIDLASAQRQVDAIEAEDGQAMALQVDLGDEASVVAMIDAVVQRFGGLDILHNNAADTRLSSTRDMPVETVDTEVWDAIMRVNLRGTMVASRTAIPHLRKRGGSIINTSSDSSLAGAMSHSAYSAVAHSPGRCRGSIR